MKVHNTKILLFFFPLNILLTLYQEHNNNEAHTAPHYTPTTTLRGLSECDIQSSIYDKNEEMKSVKDNFDRQTSQRFEEYEERMKDKRQKHKEERDNNIQKIIEKDKMEKSLTEKIENGFLRCGCGLGGGVLPVWGLVSGLWYATLSKHVTKMAIQKGIEKGIKEGLDQIFQIVREFRTKDIPTITAEQMLSSGNFTNGVTLYDMVQHINNSLYDKLGERGCDNFWIFVHGMTDKKSITEFNNIYGTHVAAVEKAFEEGKAAEFVTHTSLLSNTIIASVVTILIIVLVMIIIYLVLRYRRKKKMNKKAQYTKLINQ
ncbi:rifin PIR protein,putative [Plasmodium sp. DRC-Itaito]|nr:rifin PIR protein,putative [Plasmodium sp. DRC-Itaito]